MHKLRELLELCHENRIFAYAKTKAQISCAVTVKLISTFVFATRIVQFLFFLNFKGLANFCSCTCRFVSEAGANPEKQFSCDAAQISNKLRGLLHRESNDADELHEHSVHFSLNQVPRLYNFFHAQLR